MPDGEITPIASNLSGRGWTVIPATSDFADPHRKRIAYIEAYGAGSHARIARLLQRYSRHALDLLLLDRDHWRWLALSSHRLVRDALASAGLRRPDAIILSGPLDLAKLLAVLPAPWRDVPRAVYFHESQWTYPGTGFDRRPYLLGHLEALELCDHAWFNSRYHRDAFRNGALSTRSLRVRRLASELIGHHWHKVRVVYPPVRSGSTPSRADERFRVVWAARWEPEKRPDLLVAAVLRCAELGLEPLVHLLGAAYLAERAGDPVLRLLSPYLADPSGYVSRADYETTLEGADAWVSTAEHEFFGVAALEAAMAGVTPVLPQALAYPETLPSAVFYPAGDVAALADRLVCLSQHRPGAIRPWTIDALRFEAARVIDEFDRRCDELVSIPVDSART